MYSGYIETDHQKNVEKWRQNPNLAYIAVMRGGLELLSGILTRIGIYKDIFELLAPENAIKVEVTYPLIGYWREAPLRSY